jgi:tripartite-type tricarboxylate transporter receptor subunit TctC
MEEGMRRVVWIRAVTCLAVSLLCTFHAHAQFFAGKTVTMVINYGVGGNADTEGRIFVRHLARHIAGSPTIIVQNVPGAGGLTAINLMGTHAGFKSDGTTIGYFTFNAVAPIIDDPTLRVKMADFAFISGVGGWVVTYGRKEILHGQPVAAGMKAAKDLFVGGYAPNASHDVRLKLTLSLIGAKFKMVTGFPDSGSVNKAMLQNEINYTASTLPGFTNQAMPQLVGPGIAQAIWQYPVSAPDGGFASNERLNAEGVKSFVEIYREAYGKPPAGPSFDAFVLVNDISTKLARVALMPPGTPAEAVAEMRQGFAALATDEEFLEEYRRIIKEKAELTGAEEGQAILERLRSVKPEIKSALAKAVEE